MSVWAFFAAMVAAASAWGIALWAYPRQKQQDRLLKIAEEKRSAYQHFFEAVEIYFAALRTAAFELEKPLADDEFSRLESSKAQLAFRCDENGVSACADVAGNLHDYRKAIKDWRKATSENQERLRDKRDEAYRRVNESRLRAIMAGRKDVGMEIEGTASETSVRRLFRMKV